MVKGGKNFQEHLEHFVSEQKSRFQVRKGHFQAQKSRFEVVLGWVRLHQYQYSIDWSMFLDKKDLSKSKPRGLFLDTLVRSFLYKFFSFFLSKLPVFFF